MDKKDVDNLEKSNTIVYTIRWNPLKSIGLKRMRGISFKEVLNGSFLDICKHPYRSNQRILIVDYKGHIWAVPFVIEERGIFLKTLYPSRKYRKLYKKG